MSRTRLCTRTVGGTDTPRMDSGLSFPDLQIRPSHGGRQGRRIGGRRAPLYHSQVPLTIVCVVFILFYFFAHPFSRESGLTGFAQGLRTPVSGCADSSSLLTYLTLFTLLAVPCTQSPLSTTLPLMASATRHHGHGQAWVAADPVKYITPRTLPLPRSCTTSFPCLHRRS